MEKFFFFIHLNQHDLAQCLNFSKIFQSANVAIGKCRDRQMSRPTNVATGKCRDSDRQKSDRRGSVGRCRTIAQCSNSLNGSVSILLFHSWFWPKLLVILDHFLMIFFFKIKISKFKIQIFFSWYSLLVIKYAYKSSNIFLRNHKFRPKNM